MDSTIADQLEDLEANIDDLSTTLTPLLSQPLSKQTSTLPLLDRAKLHILHAYAIESLLFSALLTSGIDAKSHPIFKELARLKGYFGKVKDAEEISEKVGPSMKLDKGAAGRFIRAGLAGNEKVDKERKERVAREKARAKLLAARGKGTKKRFDSDGEEIVEPKSASEGAGAGEKDTETAPAPAPALVSESREEEEEREDVDASHNKKRKHSTDDQDPPLSREERKARSRAEKAARKIDRANGYYRQEELLVPKKDEKGPRTPSETFKALLEGPLPKRVKGGKGKDKKGK